MESTEGFKEISGKGIHMVISQVGITKYPMKIK